VVSVIPVVSAFLLARRQLVEGIVPGAAER
jgi:ABC-type glycerol-3-phosphate transport system permease component